MTIKLKYEEKCAPIYKTSLSAGADVVSRLDAIIYAGQTKVIPTGVFIESAGFLDNKAEIQLRIRSSLAKTLIIPNGVGTIDLDYRDEIGIMLHNPTKENIKIEQFQRIGQLVLTPIMRFDNIEVKNNIRDGGFGSTDKQGD